MMVDKSGEAKGTTGAEYISVVGGVALPPQSSSPASKRASLEQIVRM
jgi:hypothetical protein